MKPVVRFGGQMGGICWGYVLSIRDESSSSVRFVEVRLLRLYAKDGVCSDGSWAGGGVVFSTADGDGLSSRLQEGSAALVFIEDVVKYCLFVVRLCPYCFGWDILSVGKMVSIEMYSIHGSVFRSLFESSASEYPFLSGVPPVKLRGSVLVVLVLRLFSLVKLRHLFRDKAKKKKSRHCSRDISTHRVDPWPQVEVKTTQCPQRWLLSTTRTASCRQIEDLSKLVKQDQYLETKIAMNKGRLEQILRNLIGRTNQEPLSPKTEQIHREKKMGQLSLENRDPLNSGLVQLLSSYNGQLPQSFAKKMLDQSLKPVISSEYTELSVVTKFKGLFFELMHQLENTTPHLIRCIKPNCKQVPDKFEKDVVLHQLRYCGILEVVRISKSGYPTRMTHQKFTERYFRGHRARCLFLEHNKGAKNIQSLVCGESIRRKYAIEANKCSAFASQLLDEQLTSVVYLQSVIRGWTGRKVSEAKVFPTVDMETPHEQQIQVVPSVMAELQRRVLKAEVNLASAYKDSGDVETTVKSYKQALFFRPNFPEANCNLQHTLQYVRNGEKHDKIFTEVEEIIRRHITTSVHFSVQPFYAIAYPIDPMLALDISLKYVVHWFIIASRFACCNPLFQMDPEIFNTWCNILKCVPDSAHWLLKFPAAGEIRLRVYAAAEGVQPDQIIFTDMTMKQEHSRHSALADLCLDTPLCNKYTTGTNALWAGLPMVIQPLKKMATRFVGSLCLTTGLDMIVHSMKDYEEGVVDFALNRPRLQSLTSKLKEVCMTWSLFDTARWVQNLERAYFTMIIEGRGPSLLEFQSYHQTSVALRKGLKLVARFYGSIVIDKRREQEHNQIPWMKLGLENVTVVNYIVLPAQFSYFDPWGQGSFRGEGIVTIRGEAIRIGARELGKSEKGLGIWNWDWT
ncbi:Pentatricopeptide repeat-containing protein [Hibiscus syriacus]|uniref:protein O-GlcNAc transferase n=1 Tax=Hibiscus syriacus TaxID=106335 RepID=A0A6A3CRT6_HIBSY|nr:Pentatricopeptide repeat-containing protein [Hibiscus syriacus]